MTTPQLIAFDADDTLWPNQPHFDRTEAELYTLLTERLGHELDPREARFSSTPVQPRGEIL